MSHCSRICERRSYPRLSCFRRGAAGISAAPVRASNPLGPNLYAYISDNDGSANSTFLVGPTSILVVDCGLDRTEGGKILREIRKISPLPIAYIVNTHYHPDHQGGNGVVGPDATIISSPFTREKTIAVAAATSKPDPPRPARPATNSMFRPATITFTRQNDDLSWR